MTKTLREQLDAIFTEYDKPSTTRTYPGQKVRVRRGLAMDAIEVLCQKAAIEAVRNDRLATARLWKDNIDRMFDREITIYTKLTEDKATS